MGQSVALKIKTANKRYHLIFFVGNSKEDILQNLYPI